MYASTAVYISEDLSDTIRISLTGDPVEEVHVGKDILRSLNLLNDKIKIVSYYFTLFK